MHTTSTKDIVMRRVQRIHLIRKVVHPIRFKVFLFCSGLVATTFSVSVPQVFENMFGRATLLGYFEYLGKAFLHTELFVQVALMVMVIGGFLYMREFFVQSRERVSL
jgi:hypothetical protein